VPAAWGGLTEEQHVALLQQPTAAQHVLADLRAAWQLALLEVPLEQSMALTDYTVLPLQPVGASGIT
jgi:hypothetical protein